MDPLAADVVQEAGLSTALLETPDPAGAVAYFETAARNQPDNLQIRRDLGRAYVRAGRHADAHDVFGQLIDAGNATDEDRVEFGYAAVRIGKWEAAALAQPQEAASARAALLKAMIADRAEQWDEADSAYALAVSLSSAPARALNNWGVSLMGRGDLAAAEARFADAVLADPDLFLAKNNLVIARASGRNYELPPIPVTELERARLLYNTGVMAERLGDRVAARRLYADALALHPMHYPAAAERLAALSNGGAARR